MSLGRGLLVIYLVIAVTLIALIWADNLGGEKTMTPGYVRDTYNVDESVSMTVTAEAATAEQSLATPTPTVATP